MFEFEKIQSEKLRNKVIESTHQPPHENLLLVDLPGEEWKPFPVAPFDEGYAVSNKGRVKRVEHTIMRIDGISTKLTERIKKQHINCYFNRYLKENGYHLTCCISLKKRLSTFSISRLVYHVFVAPFDLFDMSWRVRHKDGNGLNCLPENLYLFERRKLTQWLLDNGRKSLLSGASDRSKYSKEEIERWNDISRRAVSQYDMQGCLVRTFKSRTEAAQSIGVSNVHIADAARGETPTIEGFMWREGADSAKQIDIPYILKPIKVAKYSLSGELTCIFFSIVEAAQNVNLSASEVVDRIYGRSPHKRFILKTVDEDKDLPEKIAVESPPDKTSNSQKYGISEENKYPFQKFSCDDLPGEEWKAIPDTDSIYWISNLGRVKSVDHIFKHGKGRSYMKRGKIQQQSFMKKTRAIQPYLIAHFKIRKKESNNLVSRLVYKLFKGEVSSKYTIVHKDNDSFNCNVENLELKSLSSLRKGYFQQGIISSEIYKKPVAQYTLDGKHIATYPSLTEAVRLTGFNCGKISECANGKRKTHRRFLWKYIQSEKETKCKSNNII